MVASRRIVSLTIIISLLTGYAMAQSITKKIPIKFLALGDSYTIGESVTESERWPVQLINELMKQGYDTEYPKIIATTGWRTDDLKRAIHDTHPAEDFTLVSLLIGVNNQYQGKSVNNYEAEFEELLKIGIEHAGGDKSKVFVVSIPDYGFTPFGKANQVSITKALDKFNAVNKSITEKYGIKYFNITDISRKAFQDPELVATDGLHPSGKMYSQWVELILKGLEQKH